MKILIVDDIPTNRKLLRAVLEEGGHSAVEAADGVEAIASLEKDGADAIVSDILMPRMDGFRLCYEIRNDKRFRRLPFIIYTATYTSKTSETLASEVGADLFLKKPVPSGKMLEALQQFTGARQFQRPTVVIPDDRKVLKQYSGELADKLEKKCAELETSKTRLTALTEELEHRLRTLADSMPHIVWRAGPEGGVTFYNTQWYEYTGLSYKQSKGSGWAAALHPDEQVSVAEGWAKSVETGVPFETECRVKRGSDGIYRRFLVRARATRDDSWAIVQWIGTFTDVDSHERIEQATQHR